MHKLCVYGEPVCSHKKETCVQTSEPYADADTLRAHIESTLLYTQLISYESDEYHSAVSRTVDEARKLLEEDFEYVCHKDDIMLFRKRKSPAKKHGVNSCNKV